MTGRHAVTPTDTREFSPDTGVPLVSCRFCGRLPTQQWDNAWACFCEAGPRKIVMVYDTPEQWNSAQVAPFDYEPPRNDDDDPVAAAIVLASWVCFVLLIVAIAVSYAHGPDL